MQFLVYAQIPAAQLISSFSTWYTFFSFHFVSVPYKVFVLGSFCCVDVYSWIVACLVFCCCCCCWDLLLLLLRFDRIEMRHKNNVKMRLYRTQAIFFVFFYTFSVYLCRFVIIDGFRHLPARLNLCGSRCWS